MYTVYPPRAQGKNQCCFPLALSSIAIACFSEDKIILVFCCLYLTSSQLHITFPHVIMLLIRPSIFLILLWPLFSPTFLISGEMVCLVVRVGIYGFVCACVCLTLVGEGRERVGGGYGRVLLCLPFCGVCKGACLFGICIVYMCVFMCDCMFTFVFIIIVIY